MKRVERKRGLAHLLRGGAVVVMSLFLTIFATVPSNAVTPTLELPTVPKLYIPAHWTAATQLAPKAVTGVGPEAAGCFANRICSLVLLGTAALAAVGTAAVLWEHDTPNADVPPANLPKPSLFIEYPSPTTNGEDIAWTLYVSPGSATTSWPYNAATFYDADCSDYGCYKLRHQVYNDDDPTTCRGDDGAGWFTKPAPGFYQSPPDGSYFYVKRGPSSVGQTLNISQNSRCYSAVRYQIYLKATDGSGYWATYDQSLVSGEPSNPAHGSLSSSFSPAPNPDRRLRTETRCTTPAGVSTTNVTTSNTYKHTDATLPGLQDACPSGSRSTAVAVFEEKKATDATDWVPSGTTVVLPPVATPACQPGNSGALSCRPGLLYELTFSDLILDPTWQYSDCVIGAIACSAEILDITNPNQPIDCGVTLCPTLQATADAVEAGTGTWTGTNFVCQYGPYELPISDCAHTLPVAGGVSYTTQPQPSPSPSPTTPPNPDGDGFACGFDLGCYVAALFQPTPAAAEARFQNVQAAFEGTPFRIIPMAAGDFLQPFSVNDFAPNSENCAGPTLTLPKDMGVDGVNVSGDYVIRPLYACPDTPAGQFGAQISTYVRAILGPTVYVAGTFMVVNTLLSAMGLALPMFVRGSEVDEVSGEISPTRWRMKNPSARRTSNRRWTQNK